MTHTPLDYALSYLGAGFAVLPLYWFDDVKQRCACGRADCASPGKHPIGQLTPRGLQDATRSEGDVRRWWKMYPRANPGIRTGAESGLVALDVDPRHDGTASLQQLMQEYGDFTDTFTVATGSGGQHFYFQHPGAEVKNSAGMVAPGIDVRGDGGYVVAAPASHESGGTYEVAKRRPIAPLPAFILEKTRTLRHASPAGPVGEHVEGVIPHGTQHHTLVSLAGTMRRRGMLPSEILPALREVNKRCEKPGTVEAMRRIAETVGQYAPEEILSVGSIDLDDRGDLQTLGALALETVERIRQNISGERQPMRYGFQHLDHMTGGAHRGELAIIAARPSMGKTTLGATMSMKLPCRSAIFSVEMARHPLVERYLAQTSGVDGLRIRSRDLTATDMRALDEAAALMAERTAEQQIYITDRARTLGEMQRALDAVETDVVFVDYLQLLSPDAKRKQGTREQDVAEVSRGLKRLAIERDLSVIALCQLNRGLEHRAERRPMLADLRESGQLEQDADVVMFLHRAELYGADTVTYGQRSLSSENLAELIIAKQRNGPLGTVLLQFDGPHYTFREYALEYASQNGAPQYAGGTWQ